MKPGDPFGRRRRPPVFGNALFGGPGPFPGTDPPRRRATLPR